MITVMIRREICILKTIYTYKPMQQMNDSRELYYSKTSPIRTPLNRNSAKPNKPILEHHFI